MFDTLTTECQSNLYRFFLFDKFLKSYQNLFSFPNWDSPYQHSYYSWENYIYQQFMMQILRSLEPRRELGDTILFKELEDIDEVIFFPRGVYDIGYSFGGEIKYKLRFTNRALIGAYPVTFGKKTEYVYRTVTTCRGFFIRKSNWKNIMNHHEEITDQFKAAIMNQYA